MVKGDRIFTDTVQGNGSLEEEGSGEAEGVKILVRQGEWKPREKYKEPGVEMEMG
jgi:hypothetical protein